MRRCAVRILGTLMLVLLAGGCAASRDPAREARAIAETLHLAPGMYVADVGAGDGWLSEDLAEFVGETGQVYATEVAADWLKLIERRIKKKDLHNVTALLGDDDDTGLPDECCDAVLLRLTYHHFTDPSAMRASLRRALRPGGLLLVVEFHPRGDWPQPAGVPPREGHGISPEDLIREMRGSGFETITEFEDWESGPGHYCVVFRRSLPGP